MNDLDKKHHSILSIFASLTGFDETESADLIEILAWLRSTADIYRRATPATPDRHLAVYCVPVDLSERRVFLGYHLRAQRWLPPGGHVDIGELPQRAALRECEEELATVPDLYCDGPVLASVEMTVGLNVHTDMTLWFAFDCSARTPLALTEQEFGERAWVPFAGVARLDTNPNLGRFLAKLGQLHAETAPVRQAARSAIAAKTP